MIINGISVITVPIREKLRQINEPFFGDTYQLLTRPNEFILKDLYARAVKNPNGVGTAHTFFYPKLKVVRGDKKTVTQILRLGSELKNADPNARSKFNIINELFDRETLITMTGRKGAEHRAELMPLLDPKARVELYKLCVEKLDGFIEKWDHQKTLQDNLSYIVINILAPSFFGIPEIDWKYVPTIRAVTKIISNNKKSPEFYAAKKILRQMHTESVEKYAEEIYASRKDLYIGIPNPNENDSPEQKKAQLMETRLTPGIIVESNISGTLGAAIAWLTEKQIEKIREELRRENLVGITHNNDAEPTDEEYAQSVKSLSNLTYLDAVFTETLRMLAPIGAMPRDPSSFFSFKTHVNNKESVERVMPYSTVIVPIRNIQNDPLLWDQPEIFNPSRKHTRDFFFPFSMEKRMCPAQLGYAAVFFKALLAKIIIKYDVLLDKRAKPIPNHAVVAHVEELHAKLIDHEKRLTMRR